MNNNDLVPGFDDEPLLGGDLVLTPIEGLDAENLFPICSTVAEAVRTFFDAPDEDCRHLKKAPP